MYQSAIFDLDGTLINSLPDIGAAMNRSLAQCGLPGFAIEAYRLKVGNGVFKIAERSVGDRTDLLPRVLALYMRDYAENCCVDSFVYPGIPEALARMAAWGKNGHIYPVGSGRTRPLREYFEIARDEIDPALPLGIGELPYPMGQVMHLQADLGPLKEDTGFEPRFSFEEGIRETVRAFRKEREETGKA